MGKGAEVCSKIKEEFKNEGETENQNKWIF